MPGVVVTTGETLQSAGISLRTGTVFVVAPAAYGPETPTLVRSLNEAVQLFGPREGESVKLYDAIDRSLAIGAARAYVQRISGEGAAAAAKLELETTGKKKTLIVAAKYKGTYGNGLKLEVIENAGKTAVKLVVLNPEGEVLEVSGEYAKAEELLAWGKTHEAYVVITEASEYTAGKGEKLEKLASTKLASGGNPTVNEKSTIKGIEAFTKSYGPGQLIVPGNTEEKVHVAMAEWSLTSKTNRVALADLKGAEEAGTTPSSLKSEKGTIAAGLAGNILFFASAGQAPGIAGGTTRTIPASVIAAGLFAKVARTGNDNQAPAGVNWPLGPAITGLVNTYTEAQMTELEESGINPLAEINGQICLYGDTTALARSKDPIFCQYSAARERMHLVAEAEEIGQRFLFSTLDGRHQRRALFQGELQAMVKRHWEAGALYGETAAEAGEVKVGEPVNTLVTEQEGQLNAELIVRISPVATVINIRLTSTPITEAV
jgi:hypothetical protein